MAFPLWNDGAEGGAGRADPALHRGRDERRRRQARDPADRQLLVLQRPALRRCTACPSRPRPPPTPGPRWTSIAKQRAGLLTHAGHHGRPGPRGPHLVHPPRQAGARGAAVHRRCRRPRRASTPARRTSPPPPTAKERSEHAPHGSPTCAACHALFDPLGLRLRELRRHRAATGPRTPPASRSTPRGDSTAPAAGRQRAADAVELMKKLGGRRRGARLRGQAVAAVRASAASRGRRPRTPRAGGGRRRRSRRRAARCPTCWSPSPARTLSATRR